MNKESPPSKTRQFKALLQSDQLEFLCEAHNGLSAKIVEEAGFKGIWASGLTLSAQFGVRDNNEASWTQILDHLEFMSDATRVPILLDGDTGYGNFNNMQRLIRKLEQRRIAAVCIEDKLFPKTNSFLRGETQPLADIDEFCGKIKAGKDAQTDEDFCLIARVEAFICGWGLSEALKRAEAYHRAGADGILIHSALAVPDEILAFKQEWGDRCPVVIVPTKYYATLTDVFRQHGFSLVIWANQLLRAAVTVMQKTARTLKEKENLFSIEDKIAPVAEIFRLQDAAELQEAEKRYLPHNGAVLSGIVLAASRGNELGELTQDRPKTMVPIQGLPILSHIVDAYNTIGVKNITVVRGYKKEAVSLPHLTYVDNDDFAGTGELVSLFKALQSKNGDFQDTIISIRRRALPHVHSSNPVSGTRRLGDRRGQRLGRENVLYPARRIRGMYGAQFAESVQCQDLPQTIGTGRAARIHSRGVDGILEGVGQRSRSVTRHPRRDARRSRERQSGHVAIVSGIAETWRPDTCALHGRALA